MPGFRRSTAANEALRSRQSPKTFVTERPLYTACAADEDTLPRADPRVSRHGMPMMSLRARIFSAVRWTAFTTGARVAVQLLQVAVLARILAPADFGLLAVVSATLAFAVHFTDFGFNSALVQRQAVTDDQRCSLFWANIVLATTVAAVVAGLAPLLAWLVDDDRVTELAALSSVVLVVHATSCQLKVKAEKDLDFKPVVLIEMVAMVATFAASVALALLDMGARSIVLGSLLGAVLGSALVWLLLRKGWRPRFHLKLTDLQPFASFGGHLVLNNVVNQVNAVADIFIGNRILGADLMGLYAIPRALALQIQDAVNPIVTRVGFPLIAKVQNDNSQVARIYLHTLRMTSSINAPIYFFLFGFAAEVITVLLGDAWLAAVPTLRVLAIWGALRSIGNPVGSLLLGVGRADLSLRWNIALLLLVPGVIWFSSSYGISGLATALLLVQVTAFIPGWYFLVRRTCGIELTAYADAALRPMFLAAAACASAIGAAAPIDNAAVRCGIGVVILPVVFVALSVRWNRDWLDAMLELTHLPPATNWMRCLRARLHGDRGRGMPGE